jgi:uncharacterized protein (TIGR02246 family)
MKRLSFLLLIALLFRSPHLFAADTQAAAVQAVLTAQVESWNKSDLEGFLAAYWKSDDLVFFSGGTVSNGHKAVSDRYQKRYKADGKEMGRLAFTDLDVQLFGSDAAMVRGKWKLQLKDEKPEGLFTLILKKQPEGWKITHDHTSAEPAKKEEKK